MNIKVYNAPVNPTVNTVVLLIEEDTVIVPATVVKTTPVNDWATILPSDSLNWMVKGELVRTPSAFL